MLPSILVFKQSEVSKVADVSKVNGQATQRAELHRRIWAIADDVRGAVDGWDFKQYILGILFYRFISENITDFFKFARREKDDKIKSLIEEEKLKEDSTRFIHKSIDKGYVAYAGDELDNILPPTSRRKGARERKKESVLEKIRKVVEVFVGI